jgi:predicted phage-related endonuclease
MEAGLRFEGGVLDWAERQIGPIVRNPQNITRSRPDLHLFSNVDAVLRDGELPIEAKTAGLFGPLVGSWGDENTDQVPDHVYVQAHVHMLCVGGDGHAPQCFVPAFLGGRGFVMFVVPRSSGLSEMISQAAVEFWERNVIQRIPPSDSLPTLDMVKRVRREPKKIVPVDPILVANYLTQKASLEEAKKAEAESRRELLAALGDAEAGDAGTEGTFTYMRQTRRSLDSKALKAEHSDLVANYMRETSFPVLRFPKRSSDDGE